jgi:hypothetical protein
VSDCRPRSSLRRDGRRVWRAAGAAAVILVAAFPVAPALAGGPLEPDPSPGAPVAGSALQPDPVGPVHVAAESKPAAPARATQATPPPSLRIETVPLRPKTTVAPAPKLPVAATSRPVEKQLTVPAPAPVQHRVTTPVAAKAPKHHATTPSHHHTAQPARPRPRARVRQPVAPLEFRAASPFTAATKGIVPLGLTRAPATNGHGSPLTAGLAFLALALASGSLVSLVYRLYREHVEV